MTLGTAAWSLSGRLSAWGMTAWLAIPLSVTYDVSGLVAAAYARRAIERNTPAGLARLTILGFVSCSAALNWSEGQRLGGAAAAYALGALSALVELLFELHRRDVRDEQRARGGLVAERLPHIPLAGWIMYPTASWALLRRAVGERLNQLEAPADSAATSGPTGPVAALLPPTSFGGDARPRKAVAQPVREGYRPVFANSPRRPQGEIARAIREAVSKGITDPDELAVYVRMTVDPEAPDETILRTRRRVLEEQKRR
jgi:hypothetical protein